MRSRGIVGSLLAAVALVLFTPAIAQAEDPVELGGAYVLDESGVLGADAADARAAVDELFARTGAKLFVVLVPTFTNPSDADAWAEQVALDSGLGDSDLLLALATDDRIYAYSVGEEFPLTVDRLDQIVEERLIPELRGDDWAGGIAGFADGIGDELEGSGIPVLPILAGIAVVGVGAFLLSRMVKRRRTAAAGELDEKQLDQRAGSLLVGLDDALKTSEQELGFAQAQFGERATAEFATALDAAQKQVKAAFALRQRLDDAEPETPEQRREMTLQIIALCEQADAALDAQAAAFDELRKLEANAGPVLEQVAAEHAGLAARIDEAEATIADLRKRFGDPGVASVHGNIEQARKLDSFAGTAIEQARAALAQKAADAAVAVRGAQQAVGQVGQLLAAVDRLAVQLPELGGRLASALEDARSDIAAAATASAGATPADRQAIGAAVAETERVIAAAGRQDPATALAAVERADAALDQAIAAYRDRQAAVARASAQLERATTGARGSVAAAQDFITTRRGAVGAAARTRVAEAERHLTQALTLATTDPVAALAEAQQADQLAAAALDLARSDVQAAENSTFGPPGGGAFGGAVLGGILGDLLGGSGSSGGFGGGGWSGSSPGGFGGSHSRPSRPSRPARSSGRRGGSGRF